MSTLTIEDTLGITFCKRQPVAIERGEGCRVWDEAGAEYLDFTSGWGVTCLGHAHPAIVEALTRQASKIIQNPNSGFTYSPPRARLLTLLRTVLPDALTRVYFVNSGAEANDAALKLARKVTGRSKVIATTGAFHGRTLNTLSVSGGKDNSSRYLPVLPDISFVEFGNTQSLAHSLDADTAAVIVEPVQGEGGVRIPAPDYLASVARLCKQHGALLIVDEVQTGFCRTGKFFALEHGTASVAPDIMTLGKGIAGGFPFAAFAVNAQVETRLQPGDHGGTYSGNPLGCAVAEAVVNYLITHNVAARVQASGSVLRLGLLALQQRYPTLVRSVRGLGLLCAMELPSDALVESLTQACLERGLLVTPTRNRVIRLIPSLLIERTELTAGLDILDTAMGSVVLAA